MKDRNPHTARNWKQSFDPGFDENDPNGRHLKTGLSLKQKHWIKDMWTAVTGSVHCIFPIAKGDRIEECGRTETVELHHVYPQGASKRMNEDPDRPRNVVPICAEHHRKGQRNQPLERETQNVIHLDSAWANRNYGKDKDTYEHVGKQRRQTLDAGQEYWVPFWDGWFRNRAEEVTTVYSAKDHEPFPENKNQREHHEWVWNPQTREWEWS